jgi:hypothetical protein
MRQETRRVCLAAALVGGLAGSAFLAKQAFDAADERHRAAVKVRFEQSQPVPDGMIHETELVPDDALAWETVRRRHVDSLSVVTP